MRAFSIYVKEKITYKKKKNFSVGAYSTEQQPTLHNWLSMVGYLKAINQSVIYFITQCKKIWSRISTGQYRITYVSNTYHSIVKLLGFAIDLAYFYASLMHVHLNCFNNQIT